MLTAKTYKYDNKNENDIQTCQFIAYFSFLPPVETHGRFII